MLAEVLPVGPEWLQYGSFGLLSVIVLYILFWVGPKIVAAVQNIEPSLLKYMREQEDRHRDWMDQQESRHATERKEFRDMLASLLAADRPH